MRATLEFDLPKDKEAFEKALRGHERACALEGALEDLGRKLRGKVKNCDEPPKSWEEVRELFIDCVEHVMP